MDENGKSLIHLRHTMELELALITYWDNRAKKALDSNFGRVDTAVMWLERRRDEHKAKYERWERAYKKHHAFIRAGDNGNCGL